MRNDCKEGKQKKSREGMKNVDNQARKKYLLPSIRLPGRGLPLKMAAAHHKGKREVRKGMITVHNRGRIWQVRKKRKVRMP